MTLLPNLVFERLFHHWCLPHTDLEYPSYLEGDPTKAYGLYAFGEGFKLALSLAFLSLDKGEGSHP